MTLILQRAASAGAESALEIEEKNCFLGPFKSADLQVLMAPGKMI